MKLWIKTFNKDSAKDVFNFLCKEGVHSYDLNCRESEQFYISIDLCSFSLSQSIELGSIIGKCSDLIDWDIHKE